MGFVDPPILTDYPQYARRYNGTNQSINLTSGVVSALPFTMACWFNSASSTVTQALMAVEASGSLLAYRLLAAGATAGDPVSLISTDTGGATSSAVTATGYIVGKWHHAAGVIASNISRTPYLDGVAGATATASRPISGADRTSVGRLPVSNSAFMNGRIACPFIWSVALNRVQIEWLARGGKPWKLEPKYIVSGPDSMGLVDPYLPGMNSRWTSLNAPGLSSFLSLDTRDEPFGLGGSNQFQDYVLQQAGGGSFFQRLQFLWKRIRS